MGDSETVGLQTQSYTVTRIERVEEEGPTAMSGPRESS